MKNDFETYREIDIRQSIAEFDNQFLSGLGALGVGGIVLGVDYVTHIIPIHNANVDHVNNRIKAVKNVDVAVEAKDTIAKFSPHNQEANALASSRLAHAEQKLHAVMVEKPASLGNAQLEGITIGTAAATLAFSALLLANHLMRPRRNRKIEKTIFSKPNPGLQTA